MYCSILKKNTVYSKFLVFRSFLLAIVNRVVKAPFLKAVAKAVSRRLIKASEMLVAPRISEYFLKSLKF